jgi:hypothetical protein
MVKLLAVLLVSGCLGVTAHAQGKSRGDLRSALKQSVQLGTTVPSPRQLSPEERAELRRQLIQHSRRPGKGG